MRRFGAGSPARQRSSDDQEGHMAVNSPADLFLYELSGMYDGERKTAQLFGEIVGHVRDDSMAQLLRINQEESQQKVRNLEMCFQELGSTPRDIPCATIDGMRAEYQQFASQQPPEPVLEMYALGMAMKIAHHGMAAYRGLVDKAMLMNETRCAQMLQTNLVQKEESAGRLERINHEMGQRILATA
jgi:ferritin-like metal-binding protein YciE